MIVDGEAERRPLDAAFDYVIVGSGAAGATAARVLADTGASIAVVEEGPRVDTAEMEERALPSLRRLYREMGTQAAHGRALIPVLQGRCLGGSTVVNSAITWRLPEQVWASWVREHGLGNALPLEDLHGNWDQIERELSIELTPAPVLGGNAGALREAARAMGLHARPTVRAVRGCQGSARCQLGCPHGAKQSMALTYLPYAERRGATLFTGARAERVVMDGARGVAVAGEFTGSVPRKATPFLLRSRKAIIVAASAVQTPGILRRSGVRSPHLGQHFQAHPGSTVIGVFARDVNLWSGATQGYECDQGQDRFKIESLALAPELLLPSLPRVGRAWVREMAQARRMAVWVVALRAYAEGCVKDHRGGSRIHFEPEGRDVVNMARGIRLAAKMLFAAGAQEVLPGIHGLPERLSSTEEVAVLDAAPEDPRAYSWGMTHLFGTARMSAHPDAGVVDENFAVRGTENVYVLDSSVFPTNTGVNPQHSIMAIAMQGAKRIGWGR